MSSSNVKSIEIVFRLYLKEHKCYKNTYTDGMPFDLRNSFKMKIVG